MSTIDFSQTVPLSAELRATKRDRAIAYLTATDWVVTRNIETGVVIPDKIAAERANARDVLGQSQ